MICTFSACHAKASDTEQSLLSVEGSVQSGSSSESKDESDKKGVEGKSDKIESANCGGKSTEDLIKVLEARQQTLSVQSEKRNLICRTLQCQWLLIQKQLGMDGLAL
jgi:hypothetical protein